MDTTKNYKDDNDGVLLMRSAFPKKQDKVAVARMLDSKQIITKAAQKLHSQNYGLFQKVGIERVDLEAVFMANVYVLFSKRPNTEQEVLFRFLKQRGLKLIGIYDRVSEGISEVPLAEESLELLDSNASEITPEDMTSAREVLIELLIDMEHRLVNQSHEYICKFFKKNSSLLVKNGYSFSYLQELVKKNAEEYVTLSYQDGKDTDYDQFHKLLVRDLSRFLSELKDNNG